MTNKPTWETRFHDKFTNVVRKGSIYGEERFLSTDDPRDIENFIDDLLAEQKQQLIEIIKTPMSTEFEDPEEESADYSIEDFRARLLNLIKQD